MGVYIKNWSLADWKELLKWAKIGANNAMIGEFTEVEEVSPHGDLIDRDVLNYTMLYKENWMSGTGGEAPAVWRKDIEDAPTIIPADDKGTDVPNKEEGE